MPASGITIANTFGVEAGFVAVSQFDANFAQCVNGLNTLATFGNYFVDSGSANGIVVTVPSPLIAAYTAGVPLQIKVAAANVDVGGTGATTINMNALGTKNVTYPSTAALLPGQLAAGAIISVMYDGTQFQYLGPIFGSGSFNPTWAGFSVPPAVPVDWRITGNLASWRFRSGTTGTSNSTVLTGTGVPIYLQSSLIPVEVILPNLTDNSVQLPGPGLLRLDSGAITVYPTTGGGSWTPSGTKGLGIYAVPVYML